MVWLARMITTLYPGGIHGERSTTPGGKLTHVVGVGFFSPLFTSFYAYNRKVMAVFM